MEEKVKTPRNHFQDVSNVQSNINDVCKGKDTNTSRIMSQVRSLFLSGQKLTAAQINEIVHFNDARKVISTLRADGWNITDIRLPDQRKLYWLVNPDRQLPLFPEGGDQ